jgi:iron-sulfur cluster repair protein YtfE (RIC family)
MTRATEVPADTRMMAIIHDGLRRDLARAIAVVSTEPYPDDRQRDAIGEHIGWMMEFLHAHHDGEDTVLWPLVRERDGGAGELLDAMEADHRRIAPLIDACTTAAGGYRSAASGQARGALRDALQTLADALLPHLQREEGELMPIFSVAVTERERRALEHEHFIKPKSLTQLGREGHWLLDGLDPERRRVLLHAVPPIPRFVLVRGFARRYRRRATVCWGPLDPTGETGARRQYGPAAALPRQIPLTGHVNTVVPAPIEAVWEVLTDVTRVGEWSHECRRVEWLAGATQARPGTRFRGTNKAGLLKWSRVNEVVLADQPRTFVWRTVPTRLYPDSCEWTIELEPADGGTRITQSYRVLKRPPAVLCRLYPIIAPDHRGRAGGLTDDLRRLGALTAHGDDVDATDGTGSDIRRLTDTAGIDWLPARSTDPTCQRSPSPASTRST